MKGVIWLVIVLFLASSVNALSVENATHQFSYSTYFAVIAPLPSIHIEGKNNNYTEVFRVKVYDVLPKFSVGDYNGTSASTRLVINVSEYDITDFITNTSSLYIDFIDSLNTTARIVVGGLNDYVLETYDIGVAKGFLKYKNKVGLYPFNGAIVSFVISDERIIVVYGNAIEGEVAALRYLKGHLDEFVYLDNSYFVDDIGGLSVYDYMHTKENHQYYNTDTKEFREIVNKSLFGKVDEEIIDVKSNDGVLLRVLKLEPQNSQKYIDYTHNVTLPIVLARGLWSNLYSWEDFGTELADEGREVYLIEITGGPGQDCSACVNYNFSDLINSYWPAMIGTVQALSNNSKLQYAGHSNGARAGISSLEIYNEVGVENAGSYFNGTDWVNVSMTQQPIDTFIAMGMPGAFEGVNPLGSLVKAVGDTIQEKIKLNNLTHLTKNELLAFGLTPIKYASEDNDNKIAVGLWNNYYYWISSDNDSQPGSNLSMNNLLVVHGDALGTTDGIVTIKDKKSLYNHIISNNKKHYSFFSTHSGLPNKDKIRVIVTEFLNSKRIYTSYPLNLVNETN